jgi:hypothetical protein
MDVPENFLSINAQMQIFDADHGISLAWQK